MALFLAGVLIAGDPGTKNGERIANHFADHRTTILIGVYLAGLGLLAFFVWVWSLRTILSRSGEEFLATTVLAAGVLVIAVEFPVIALDTGLAFISDQRVDPGLARALHDLAQVSSTKRTACGKASSHGRRGSASKPRRPWRAASSAPASSSGVPTRQTRGRPGST